MATDDKKNPLVFTDKRTKDKMDLHLRDINDEITEEDIANIKTDVTPNTANAVEAADMEAEKSLQKKEKEERGNKDDGNNSNNIKTSWNILDED